jgi:hypothetical protein
VTPPLSYIQQNDTHRLIPARHADSEESVLARLAGRAQDLDALFELEGATNDRLIGEANLLPGITVHELVFGVSNWHIINGCFCHAAVGGSRFNGPDRGAWYAAYSLATSQIEVAFHFAQGLREVNWQEPETVVFRDYRADFNCQLHDLRQGSRYAAYLDPDDYGASQQLARQLLDKGSAGMVYPSVRHEGGTCIACFRPALVGNVRKGRKVTMAFDNPETPPVIKVA